MFNNYFQGTELFGVNTKTTELLTKRKKILFIGGSMNQTTMMHQIANHLTEYDNYFTPFYSDGKELIALKLGFINNTILGGVFRERTIEYIEKHDLQLDYAGKKNDYDLVVTSSDLIIQHNIKRKKIVLVQEGMTDPQNWIYHLVKLLHLPRYFASTSTTGLSNKYDVFCVASEGYKDFFIRSGCDPDRMVVTGIPNFDNCAAYLNNDFPFKDYVLVCTSDMRETLKFENRKRFIIDALNIANGKQLIFKLHPNEDHDRAQREVNKHAPEALVYTVGNTEEMIANCNTLITVYSSVAYIGLALGKIVYSKFNVDDLKKMIPVQNAGTSAKKIADICKKYLN